MIQVTYDCNLACRHCSYGDLTLRPEVKLEEVQVFLKLHKPRIIKISGGEPTISSEFGEVVRLCKATGAKVVSFTNGTGHPLIDPDAYWVSLYGTRGWHQSITRSRTYNNVLEFIENHKVEYLCSPVFSEKQILSLNIKSTNLGIPMRITRLLPHGLASGVLSLEQQREILLRNHLVDYPNVATCSLGFAPFKCKNKACLKPDGQVIVCTSMARGTSLCPFFKEVNK